MVQKDCGFRIVGKGILSLMVTFCVLCLVPVMEFTEATGHDVTFVLGSTTELTGLYSYPNFEGDKKSLEQTVEHYLSQSLQRDLTINAKVDVTVEGGIYTATISGASDHVEDYDEQLVNFLNSGRLAVRAVENLKADGIWNEKEWFFFLPHGLSLAQQYSVQLLHFPPDYSLTGQDYLNSKTSKRWEQLLELNDVNPEEVTLYEAILDIAPIAAPSNAGSSLSETYTYFQPYVLEMLPILLKNKPLPIIAYGSPVRNWVSSFFDVDIHVNTFAIVDVTHEITAPILGANHPSYIWYAKNDGREKAYKVMKDDLISACWQAVMGKTGIAGNSDLNGSARKILDDCTASWENRPMDVCINMEIQAYGKSDDEAREACENDLPSGSNPKTEL